MATTLYTIGYRDSMPDRIVDALLRAGVGTLVDIRNMAVGPRVKRGFSRDELRVRCTVAGIGYRHDQPLGIPARERRNPDRQGMLGRYRTWLRHELREPRDLEPQYVADLLDFLANPGAYCLVCAEADHADCHRTPAAEELADALAERGVVAEVVHLPSP